MASKKNTNSNIDNLLQELQDIEKKLSDGELSIDDQISLVKEAQTIYAEIKEKLEKVSTEINFIEY